MLNYQNSDQTNPLIIDFTQKDALKKILPQPAVLNSYGSGWKDIHFEYHNQPSYDTPEHRPTMHSISVCLNHNFSQRWLDGKSQQENIAPGATVIIPAGVLHRSAWEKQAQFLVMAVEPLFLERLAQEINASDNIELIPHFAISEDPLIKGIGLSFKEKLESGELNNNFYIEQLTTTLALHLLDKYCVNKLQVSSCIDGLTKTQLKIVIEYVHENFHQDISLSEIAHTLEMSRYHFSRLFKKSMGISPYQYVMQQRIEKVKKLLNNKENSLTIAEIALKCGFANQSHLTKYFRQITGITPKVYQQH
ncbi:MAG: AraC family transcriptional regulator [Cyanobacteria bacterium P01_A01_bin.45]